LMFSERTGFFKKAMYAYTIYGAAITPCLVAALFWKKATWQGAIISIVSGTVVSLGWSEAFFVRFLVSPETCKKIAGQIPEWVRQLDAVLPAITASVIALIVVSLLTAKKEK
jgi:solute:Na+ symporter, SSS family